MENKIKLNKDTVLRLKIETNEGKDTGNFLEFDLEDIELPLKLQEMFEKDKKNREWIRNKIFIIDKKEDVKTDKLMSRNEEEKIRAINSFFKKQVEIYNIFLGEKGVEKLLNGRKLGWTTLEEVSDIIEKQISPYIDVNAKTINEKIKRIYGKPNNIDAKTLK